MDPRAPFLVAMLLLSGCLQTGGDEQAASGPAPDEHPSEEGDDEATAGAESALWPVAEVQQKRWGAKKWVFHAVDRQRDGGCVDEHGPFKEVEAHWADDAPRLVQLPEPGCFIEGRIDVDTDAEELRVAFQMVFRNGPEDAESGRVHIRYNGTGGQSFGGSGASVGTSSIRAWNGEVSLRLIADEANEGAVYLDSITFESLPEIPEDAWVEPR